MPAEGRVTSCRGCSRCLGCGLTIDRREATALDRIFETSDSTALEPVVCATPSASASAPDRGPATGTDSLARYDDNRIGRILATTEGDRPVDKRDRAILMVSIASNGTTPIGCRSSFRKLLIQRSFSCDLGRCLSQAEAEFPGLAMQMFDLPNPAFFLEALDPSFDERLTARQHQVDHARQLVCGCFDRHLRIHARQSRTMFRADIALAAPR